jgi:NAD(P)H-flavin reductase/hemoglobin-like flavoprotein
MDPAALKASWGQLARHGDAVPGFFYAWLFTVHPQLREFFPMSMAAQRDRLVTALGRIVSRVDELATVVPFVEELGRDHRRFDIKPEHFGPVGEALLATLAHFLGASWTPQLAADWTAAYETVAGVMTAAAEADSGPPSWGAQIIGHERRGFDVAVLRVLPEQHFPYRAGQAVPLEVPSRPRLWRYYSPASAPRRDGTLDFHIKAVPGGQVSTAIVSGLTRGDTVRLGAAFGQNLALEESTRPLLLIAGGTGLAPLKALTEQVAADGGQRQVVLIVGARTASDLYDLPALGEMARAWPWLTVIPAASDDQWYRGEQGTAGEVAAGLADQAGGWQGYHIYVCGSAAMTAATRQHLADVGVPPGRLRVEDDTCDPYRPPSTEFSSQASLASDPGGPDL